MSPRFCQTAWPPSSRHAPPGGPWQSAPCRGTVRGGMTRDEFATLVDEALADVPLEFATHLENIVVVVEDEPAPDLLRNLGLDPRRDTLFGLYHGVPLPQRGATFGNTLPDQI